MAGVRLAFVLIGLATTSPAPQVDLGCLNGSGAPDSSVNCQPSLTSPDPNSLISESSVQAIISGLELNSTSVRFRGCPGHKFETQGRQSDDKIVYYIYYNSDLNYADPTNIAPIAHELGHVFQSKSLGSFDGLKSEPREAVELGADYLAGYAFKNFLYTTAPSNLQQSLDLVGSFQNSQDPHGFPAQRTSAFRQGFIRTTRVKEDVQTAYSNFLRANLYSLLQGTS